MDLHGFHHGRSTGTKRRPRFGGIYKISKIIVKQDTIFTVFRTLGGSKRGVIVCIELSSGCVTGLGCYRADPWKAQQKKIARDGFHFDGTLGKVVGPLVIKKLAGALQ